MGPSVPSSELAFSQLSKLLASTNFQGSERLRRFLQFVVDRTLKGEADQLKEYRIGVEVFGRPASYDPRLDPVVRLEARRLRAKLQQYYEGEGLNDSIRIEVPKGAYSAKFSRRPSTSDHAPQPSVAVPHDLPLPSPRIRPRYWSSFAVAALVLSLGASGAWYLWRSQTISVGSRPASIAVLPFLNLTGDPDKDYLSDGLTDELTSSLAGLPDLRVVARTSAFQFKGKAEDVRSIGKELNVATILEGSVQLRGGQVRITAQLVRTTDGYHMWSETFERDRADILAVENEIDRAIAGRLVTSGASKGRAIEPRAHEAYLQGRYWFNRRSPAELWRAIGYFNQALERDPVYAEAYLGLADAFAVLGANDQAPSQDVFPKARAAAERALELDDGLGEAHATLAHVVSFYDWNFPRAEQEFKRAIELRPNYAAGHQWYGLLLMYQGRFDEAAKELNAAKDLDPLSLVIPLGLGRVYFYSGNYDRSLELSRSLLRYDDNFALTHDSLGQAYQRKGDYKRAVEEFQKYLRLSGQDPDALMNLGETYALAGEREQALGILRQLQSLRLGYSSPYDYAVIYASLGDKEQAYRWLDKSVEEHSSSCVLMFVDPAFRSFHSDARFQQLLRRTGHGNVEANGSAAGVRRTTA